MDITHIDVEDSQNILRYVLVILWNSSLSMFKISYIDWEDLKKNRKYKTEEISTYELIHVRCVRSMSLLTT